MNLDYAEIFAKRGNVYHRAMQRQPDARNAEFDQLFLRRAVKPGETVLDIPAGGGYLARRLPASAKVTELELSAGFTPHLRVVDAHGDWGVGKFNHTVNLAGLHHIPEPERFILRLISHTKQGGTAHIADVDASLWIGPFLDRFVGRYNVTGHQGNYLTEKSFVALPGTRLIASEIGPCPWRFASEDALLDFSADLFGLADYPRGELQAQLRPHISQQGGQVILDWRLRYIDLEAL